MERLVYPPANAPCLDCKDRFIGCHSKCEKYKQFKRKMEVLPQNVGAKWIWRDDNAID